ncbi:hypothetical protein RZS08_45055, partial [Arthrospira platensis SPKY1]|nr:hypothetical protein [Arthrospira platensis SPKY1]
KVKHIITLGAPIDMYKIIRNYCKLLALNEKLSQAFIKRFEEEVQIKTKEFDTLMQQFPQNTQGLLAHDLSDDVVLFNELGKIQNYWKTAESITTRELGHSMHDAKLYQEIQNYLKKVL